MITIGGTSRPIRLILALCLSGLLAPTVKAQFQPADFDVPDGKIESAPGNHLMVSTKEMHATLKVLTPPAAVAKFTDLGPVALEFNGPVGLRSDNAHVIFDFAAGK